MEDEEYLGGSVGLDKDLVILWSHPRVGGVKVQYLKRILNPYNNITHIMNNIILFMDFY